MAHDHLVEHHANGVDVGARIGVTGGCNFRSHVGDGAEHGTSGGHRYFGCRTCQAEVCDAHVRVLRDEDVFRFHVAVDNADTMRGVQSIKDFLRVAQCLRESEGALRVEQRA